MEELPNKHEHLYAVDPAELKQVHIDFDVAENMRNLAASGLTVVTGAYKRIRQAAHGIKELPYRFMEEFEPHDLPPR